MKETLTVLILICTALSLASPVPLSEQAKSAMEVVARLIGDGHAEGFKVEIIPQEDGHDVFEVESLDGKIVLRGSNGVSACRALKWYLNNLCDSSLSWRGDNLRIPDELPLLQEKHREATPFEYRYMFNFCTFGYSMAWWKWPEWQRTIDFLAFNGVNLPLAPLGQEKVWQETYKEFGLTREDLDGFFANPAWQPWQWMACLNGHGGPLPQSVIDNQAELQKEILAHARSLGMTPVLMGFSGHVPRALKEKFPDLRVHGVDWAGFEATHSLDPSDPRFKEIGRIFIEKQQEIFGTDHYYAIDPFIEMVPPSGEISYRANMAKLIYEAMDAGDPEGIWVMQTWFCKNPRARNTSWNVAQTKAFFDAIPDDRVLALELWGENWNGTGWKEQSGWYDKPWVWNVIQNFGDQVDIYGALPQIVRNYKRMQASSEKGNVVGIGIMMEGLDYNPVVFELVFDMMWGEGVDDLEAWKEDYVLKRYGKDIASVNRAWEILYGSRYTLSRDTGFSPLIGPPGLWDDAGPDMDIVTAWKLMLDAADELGESETYQFDLTNLGREAMGIYARHYSSLVKRAHEDGDEARFRAAADDMLQYIRDFDRLMATSEYFLLGKWTTDARSWGETEAEKDLLEWGAKQQITDWGGTIRTYSAKEWSGIVGDRALPLWESYLSALEEDMKSGGDAALARYDLLAKKYVIEWPHQRTDLPTDAQGDPIEVSREMWAKYGADMLKAGEDGYTPPGKPTPVGLAVNMPVTASNVVGDHVASYAVDGDALDRESSWWAIGPASLTVDLRRVQTVSGFQVYPYWDGTRSYQYTIEVSADGKEWSTVVDMSKNVQKATPDGHLHNLSTIQPAGFKCKYVRLNMLRNTANEGVHVVEFKLFGPYDKLVNSRRGRFRASVLEFPHH